MGKQDGDIETHVVPESIEIGAFTVAGDCLRTNLKLILSSRRDGKNYSRSEEFILFVEPHGDAIGVEVYEGMLDLRMLDTFARVVAARLNTTAGRAALKLASEGSGPKRPWLPHVQVPLPSSQVA